MSPLEQPRSAEDRPPPGNRPPPGAPRYTAGARAILRIPALAADRYTAMLDDCPADRPDWATAHHAFLQETWRLPHVPRRSATPLPPCSPHSATPCRRPAPALRWPWTGTSTG